VKGDALKLADNEKFLILLRHGVAEPKGAKPDEERALTDEGHRRMEKIAPAIRRIFPRAAAIYTSPLVRCAQTAEWVSKAYEGTIPVTPTSALTPAAGVGDFRRLLSATTAQYLIFVGHEPNLSTIAATITGSGFGASTELKKGGLYGLRYGDGFAALEWLLPPAVLMAE